MYFIVKCAISIETIHFRLEPDIILLASASVGQSFFHLGLDAGLLSVY